MHTQKDREKDREREKERERQREKETMRVRERERERERETDDNKAQEIAPYLFSFIRESLLKASSQLAKFCLSTN